MLRRLLSKLLPIEKRLEVIKTSATTLTLEQWRAEKALVGTGLKMWNNADFQMMVQVLRNEHPAWGMLPPLASSELRAARQALIEGYTLCLSNLEAMKSLEKAVELTPTYEREIE